MTNFEEKFFNYQALNEISQRQILYDFTYIVESKKTKQNRN